MHTKGSVMREVKPQHGQEMVEEEVDRVLGQIASTPDADFSLNFEDRTVT